MFIAKLVATTATVTALALPSATAQIEIKAKDITGAIAEPNASPRPAAPERFTRPPGPVAGWFLAGNNARAYSIDTDSEYKHGGAKSATLLCGAKSCGGFGTMMQTIRADEFRGHRVRLAGWVKSDHAGSANLWMRIDAVRIGDCGTSA